MDDLTNLAYCRKDMNLLHPVGHCPYDIDDQGEADPAFRAKVGEFMDDNDELLRRLVDGDAGH